MTVQVTVEKVVSKGEGLARNGGKTLFVGQTLPNERVSVSIVEERKDYQRGKLLSIEQSNANRVTPPCPYYGVCGGCDFQFATYPYQVELKENFIRENLSRIGKIGAESYKFEQSEVASEWAYRNRVRFHVDLEQKRVGFLQRESSDLVDIESCPILVPSLNHYLGSKRGELFEIAATKKVKRRWRELSAFSFGSTLSFDTKEVQVSLLGKTLYTDATLFFQSNGVLLPKLVEYVQKHARGSSIIDLYSGVGTFISSIEAPDKTTIAIEQDRRCLEYAQKNLRYTQFITSKAENWSFENSKEELDCVIVDPPRVGLDPKVIKAICSWSPTQIIYVSCESATLARDLGLFVSKGYTLRSIKLFDLYAQTSHVETVVLMSRNG